MDPVAFNFHANFMDNFENVNNQRLLKLHRRNLRDASNPFELPDFNFVKLFRLNRYITRRLIMELQQFEDQRPKRIDSIPFFLQVLICLNFYGHGSYQLCIGEDLNLCVSQPIVSRILSKISNIFAIHLLPRYVKFPVTEQQILEVKQGFMDKFNFPNTIGAIDCTHISIISPVDVDDAPAIAYLNRKGFYSINLQAICDSNMIFLNVNARYPGATHDAAIWEVSNINLNLQRRYQNGERTTWLIGDSGYPIQPWLMTPINDALPNTPEALYTQLHCRARNVIERAFGSLKSRFRCLLKHRTLHYSHGAAGKIIYACIVLHNLCKQYNLPEIEYEDKENDEDEDQEINLVIGGINILTEGRLTRRKLVNELNNL